MNKSVRYLLASVSPLAIAAGVSMFASPVEAANSVTTAISTYATENFTGVSGASTVTMPANAIRVSGNTTTDLAVGSITLTLSNSATFAAVPPVTTGGTGTVIGTVSLGTGSTSVTINVTTASTSSTSAVTVGSFSLSGVGTRLATSGNSVTVTMTTVGVNAGTNATGTIAISSQAFLAATATTGATTSIDLANSGAGLVFRSGTPASNVSFATLGTLNIPTPTAGVNDISGATQFTTTSVDVARGTISGNLTAFSSVYAIPSGSCAATAPSTAITGTLASDLRSATFSPLAVTSTYTICAVANGTSIIPAGTITGVSSIVYGSRTVGTGAYTPGSVSQTTSTMTTLAYNGSTATALYVVGAGSYVSAIRVSNTSSSAGSVFVQVTPDTTGTPLRALIDSTLAAGQSKFYLASDIRAAVGTSVLTDSNTRATVVFLSSFTGLTVQNFMVNPGGALSGGTVGGNN